MGTRLKGKVAIVTGASSGIGAAIATLFASEGAQVTIADIDDIGANEIVSKIGAEEIVCYLHTDVSNELQVQALVEETIRRFGAIDILVNNAAIVLFKRLIETEPAEWDKVIATNLRSVYLCSRYVIPHMIRKGSGAIVNISSARAIATTPLVASYDASKGAIVSLTRSLALEYAENGIRVNCVLPGAIDTPVFRANLRAEGNEEDRYRSTMEHIPIKRVGLPIDIARTVLFLASDESSYATGAPFLIDGGLLAQA